jgi:hypothetical protein
VLPADARGVTTAFAAISSGSGRAAQDLQRIGPAGIASLNQVSAVSTKATARMAKLSRLVPVDGFTPGALGHR